MTPAAFAAVLDSRVKQVTLKNAPISFTEWATAPDLLWPMSSCLPYALRTLDLPDCYAALEPKKLKLLQPWTAEAKPVTKARARGLLRDNNIPESLLA